MSANTKHTPEQLEAIANANAHLSNAGLATFDDLLAALKDIARSDEFNGGTFVKELQHIARDAIAKAEGR